MDRICRVFRARLWWCCLLCVLSVSAHSATRVSVPVSKHAASDLANATSKVRAGDTLKIGGPPLQGEYIPSDYVSSKGTKLPAKVSYDYSIPRTLKKVTSKIKGGLVGVAVTVGISLLLDEVGAFIDENGQPLKKVPATIPTPTDSELGQYTWTVTNVSGNFASPTIGCDAFRVQSTNYTTQLTPKFFSQTSGQCVFKRDFDGAVINSVHFNRTGSSCPAGSEYDSSRGACYPPTGSQPLLDADYDLIEAYANAQNSDFITGLLRDACTGSLTPDSCLESLRDDTFLSGPSTVQGPSSTSTTTFTRPDGTTGTTTTVSNTSYNVKYGNNYYDYSKSVTKTTTADGEPVSTETETEGDEVEEETPPDDAAPCTGDCTGPEYADLYTPSEMTKESELDSYAARFLAVPVIAAATSFFDVSIAGGSCPVWEYHTAMTLPLTSESMQIDLVFDYHCLPWFLNVQPFCAAVIMLGFAYLAYRVAIL